MNKEIKFHKEYYNNNVLKREYSSLGDFLHGEEVVYSFHGKKYYSTNFKNGIESGVKQCWVATIKYLVGSRIEIINRKSFENNGVHVHFSYDSKYFKSK